MDDDHLTSFLERMLAVKQTVESIEIRGSPLDPSVAAVARDYLQRAKEEFDLANYDESNEFLLQAENACFR